MALWKDADAPSSLVICLNNNLLTFLLSLVHVIEVLQLFLFLEELCILELSGGKLAFNDVDFELSLLHLEYLESLWLVTQAETDVNNLIGVAFKPILGELPREMEPYLHLN